MTCGAHAPVTVPAPRAGADPAAGPAADVVTEVPGIRVLIAVGDPVLARSIAEVLPASHVPVHPGDTDVVEAAPGVDLVLLEVGTGVPGGLEACVRVRAVSQVPIVGVDHGDGSVDLVSALDVGLDAYLGPGYELDELLARTEAVLRRAGRAALPAERLVRGPLVIDSGTREVFWRGRAVITSRKEFELLRLLASEPKRVFTRHQIMTHIWNDASGLPSRTLDTHVSSLRNKIGDRSVIVNVRGRGFHIDVPSP